jgi:hypothetical protein
MSIEANLREELDRCSNSYECWDSLSRCLIKLNYPKIVQDVMNEVKTNILQNTQLTDQQRNETEKMLFSLLILLQLSDDYYSPLVLSYISKIKTQL